jgi:hypothetical protein
MSLRRTTCLLTAPLLGVGLVAAGQLPLAVGSTFADRPTGPDHASGSTVVRLANGDRVQLAPAGGAGRSTLAPLPRDDGSKPGLILNSGDAGTTIQSMEGDTTPTVIGRPAATSAAPAAEAAGEPVELHFDAVGRDGRPAPADVTVFDVETGAVQSFRRIPGDPDAECSDDSWAESSCLLVPPGTYSVMAFVLTMPAGQPSTERDRTVQNVSLVGQPEVSIGEGRQFTFDARLAEPVSVTTPGHRTKVNPGGALQLGYTRTSANGRTIGRQLMPASMLDERFFMQPTAPVTLGGMTTLTRLRLEAPDIEMVAPGLDLDPEYYDPVWFSDVSSDFPVYDGQARLPVVDVGHATASDLAGKHLAGAIALAERSDDIPVADQSNAAANAGASLVVIQNDGPGDNDDPVSTGTKLSVPTVRLSRAEGLALKALPRDSLVGVRGETASPYLYDLVLKEHGGIPADLSYVVERDELASQVRELHGQPTIGSTFSEAAYQYQPSDSFSVSTMFPFRGGARSRVEYRLPDPETRWTYAVATPETRYNAQFPEEPVLRMLLSAPDLRAYTTTETTMAPVATAPITSTPNPFRPFQRSGDRLRAAIAGFVDADGNFGSSYSTDSGMSTLLQIRADDVLLGETDNLPSGIAQLPSGESTVEVSFRANNPQSWNQLSTHTENTWTFRSRTTDGAVVTEPVILADYDVDVDLRNRVRALEHRRVAFDLNLAHAAGSTSTAPIGDVTVEASYDDGLTWRPATVTDEGTGRHGVVLPRGTGFVSLRLHAADTAGSSLDQTIIRAWYVVG